MTAKEYFDKEYGPDHIKEVVEMGDIVSIYGLMEEYAEKCSLLHSSELVCPIPENHELELKLMGKCSACGKKKQTER
jgi:hypothetical protein